MKDLEFTHVRTAVVDCSVLALACLFAYWLATSLLSRVYFLSRADDLLGGMWAAIATIFVFRDSYDQSVAAAASRMAVTAGITTTVVMVVAAVSPLHAWQQPLLRFADTVIGVIVGVAAAWIGLRVIRPRLPG